MDNFTKREATIIAAGLFVATVLVVIGTWYLIEVFVTGSLDPLAKAGGLSPTQDIRNR